jgi:hypothetical protein
VRILWSARAARAAGTGQLLVVEGHASSPITRIVRSGLVGGNLARAAIGYGYDVVISNARGTADARRPASGTRAESLGRHRRSRGRVRDFAIVAIPYWDHAVCPSTRLQLRQPS